MALFEKNLFKKKSNLPGAGKGLFTTKFIPAGTLIVEYKGKISTWKEAEQVKGENKYIFYVKRYHVINAEPYKKAWARYANDAQGLIKVKSVTNNAEYIEKGLRVFIKAKKNIPSGNEILVDYGKEYWQAIRYNKRIDERLKKK